MADPRNQHESQDLTDYETLDANDTLNGNPGDDPLDRGLATPDRWSAGMRYALAGEEDNESLDELLAEEEPDDTVDPDRETWSDEDDNAAPRAGRLAAPSQDGYDAGDTRLLYENDATDLTARDEGIDGGAASAEEAAIHVVDDPDA
jgi:hypothetical protein